VKIGHESAIEIGYVGSKGTHQGRYFNLNQPFRSAATAPNFPVPYPGWSTINFYGFYSNSSYNAAASPSGGASRNGFFYQVNYIYSKSIDDASQLQGSGAGGYSVYKMRAISTATGAARILTSATRLTTVVGSPAEGGERSARASDSRSR